MCGALVTVKTEKESFKLTLIALQKSIDKGEIILKKITANDKPTKNLRKY